MAYNYDELEKYYNTRNYQGAIDYLNQFDFEGDDAIAVRNEISSLKRNLAIEQSIKERLVGEDADAFNFIRGLQNNYIDRDRTGTYADGSEFKTKNPYGTKYQNYINNLRTKDNTPINGLVVEIDNKDALTELQNMLKENGADDDYYGISFQPSSNGKYKAIAKTNNTSLNKLYNAVKDVQAGHNRGAVAAGGIAGTLIGGILAGIPTLGLGAVEGGIGGGAVGASIAGFLSNINSDFEIKGLSNGKTYDTSDFNYGQLEDAINLVNDAEKKYNEINDKFVNNNPASEISVSGYMGLGHAQAVKDWQAGKISKSELEEVTKLWEDALPNLISNASFADKKVYVWGNQDGDTEKGEITTGKLLNRVKNTDAENVKHEILLAMKEGRCKYSMATKDGQIGTMFSIAADEDKSNNVSDKYGNRAMDIFVEGLYRGDAEEYYEQDSKTKAARSNADMKKIGYGMELSNGVTVGYQDGIPYMQQYNSSTKTMDKVPISEDDVLTNLNESAIIDQTTDLIIKHFNTTTKKIEQEGANGTNEYTLKDFLDAISTATVNELYPKGQYSKKERDIKSVLLYSSIMRNLPKNIKSNY